VEEEPLNVAGIDIGAATAKAVLLSSNSMLSFATIPTGHSVAQAGETVLREALENAGLSLDNIEYLISTGYGRRAFSPANRVVTEITCHAAGVSSAMPQARTIIDIGGQDSKVIGLDDGGNVINFVMNDKCAAGTGRFLEVMAGVLNARIDEIGAISLRGTKPCRIGSTCTVFAESEMISLRAQGESRENMFAGIHKAMAHRVAVMGKSVGFKREVVFTGGVAKNVAMKKALEDEIASPILIPEEPQIMGAIGAAILAQADLEKSRKAS
jgi:predicted CoA-substrate-specific enzyme activase